MYFTTIYNVKNYNDLRTRGLKYLNEHIEKVSVSYVNANSKNKSDIKKFYETYISGNISGIKKLFTKINTVLKTKEFEIKLNYAPLRQSGKYDSFTFNIESNKEGIIQYRDIDSINILIDNTQNKIVARSFISQEKKNLKQRLAEKQKKAAVEANIKQAPNPAVDGEEHKQDDIKDNTILAPNPVKKDKPKNNTKAQVETNIKTAPNPVKKNKDYSFLNMLNSTKKDNTPNNKVNSLGGKSNKTKKKRSSFKNNLNSI